MRAPRARDAWRKFTETYGKPRVRAARALCIDFLVTKNTVPLLDLLVPEPLIKVQLYLSRGT